MNLNLLKELGVSKHDLQKYEMENYYEGEYRDELCNSLGSWNTYKDSTYDYIGFGCSKDIDELLALDRIVKDIENIDVDTYEID